MSDARTEPPIVPYDTIDAQTELSFFFDDTIDASSASQPYPDLQQQVRIFSCNYCDRSFATRWNLKTHMDLHDPNRMKLFACTHKGCHYASARKNDLKRHMGSCSHA
ncbi:hypothetical protein HETIRDRAFT_157336 [Heterobasidion irregulare TC 32-1]|uniref:C2H2-type domain-containing protein n=1 Tax=Heterobasidion irregulare (strain TC 32-1) TaxID=747525 RepID=W4JWK9_HETIT|nr:uncharacterized protein HETIRDRAFT_157336 [Heterobasidion irregulare TC 32-1]ETW77829.1 hypothetical protein HETIRDRAFT_157336 [Heterobasidion irregulare TC 32-1]